jgi:hypothetical protein
MKAYLATTAVLFVVLVIAHVVRGLYEPHLARDPWFILTTVLSLGMSLWALGLLRRSRAPSGQPG